MLELRTERENDIICYKYRNEISIVATVAIMQLIISFIINKCNDDLFP